MQSSVDIEPISFGLCSDLPINVVGLTGKTNEFDFVCKSLVPDSVERGRFEPTAERKDIVINEFVKQAILDGMDAEREVQKNPVGEVKFDSFQPQRMEIESPHLEIVYNHPQKLSQSETLVEVPVCSELQTSQQNVSKQRVSSVLRPETVSDSEVTNVPIIMPPEAFDRVKPMIVQSQDRHELEEVDIPSVKVPNVYPVDEEYDGYVIPSKASKEIKPVSTVSLGELGEVETSTVLEDTKLKKVVSIIENVGDEDSDLGIGVEKKNLIRDIDKTALMRQVKESISIPEQVQIIAPAPYVSKQRVSSVLRPETVSESEVTNSPIIMPPEAFDRVKPMIVQSQDRHEFEEVDIPSVKVPNVYPVDEEYDGYVIPSKVSKEIKPVSTVSLGELGEVETSTVLEDTKLKKVVSTIENVGDKDSDLGIGVEKKNLIRDIDKTALMRQVKESISMPEQVQIIAPAPLPIDLPRGSALQQPVISAPMSNITRMFVMAAEAVADAILVSSDFSNGEGKILVRLQPKVLGGSEVQIVAKNGSLSVIVNPATQDVQNIVEANRVQFEQHLAEKIHSWRITVALRRGDRLNERV